VRWEITGKYLLAGGGAVVSFEEGRVAKGGFCWIVPLAFLPKVGATDLGANGLDIVWTFEAVAEVGFIKFDPAELDFTISSSLLRFKPGLLGSAGTLGSKFSCRRANGDVRRNYS
jgi:hypothetical protein